MSNDKFHTADERLQRDCLLSPVAALDPDPQPSPTVTVAVVFVQIPFYRGGGIATENSYTMRFESAFGIGLGYRFARDACNMHTLNKRALAAGNIVLQAADPLAY